jgi:hypothetical protein
LPFSDDPQHWGQLGDYVGGLLNPVFGFLSVFALLVTLVLQSRELRLSRDALKVSQDELKLSREEQAKSAAALAEQNKVIHQQRIEQTFFSWLGTYREVLGEISHDDSHGRAALSIMWQHPLSKEWISPQHYDYPSCSVSRILYDFNLGSLDDADLGHFPTLARAAGVAWNDLYVTHEPKLDSLFRVLYRLFKWIDDQPETRLTWEDKWLYTSIVRSQLSWIEMVFLFYNGMTPRGANFKPLIERYALFDNLTVERDRLLVILRECPMDSVGYADSAYSSDAARAAHEAEEATRRKAELHQPQ